MLPDMSYNPLRESGSGEDDNKVRQALKMILEGRGTGAPEFGSVAGSAEHKALMMLGGNTGRFAGNYAVKNYDKLDPIVKEIVGSIDPKMGVYGSRDAFAGDFKAGSEEEKERMKAVKEDPEQRPYSETPRLVKSAVERRAKAKQPSASFMEEQPINFQEGGPVPVDGEGNMPPEAVAGDVINGAPVGMVDVPGGGGPTDDGVPTKLPEGSFVLNAASIEYHGTKTINDLINNAVRDLLKEGVQISMEDPNPEDDVPVAISNGEYVIPPEVAEKIGIKKLEDMNERGLEYRKKQEEAQKKEAEAQQQQPQPQPQETFMGLQMPPETPQQAAAPAPAPVQSEQQAMAMMGMADGGPISKAKDAFVNWFTDTFLGGPMIPTNESVDALLGKPEPQEPQKPPMLAPSVTVQKQEGGFIGQPMLPQQQPNMAISNPYGFSLDNPFSQQPSFIGDAAGNIVGSKKKSRVGLANGTTSPPPVPKDNPRRRPTAKFQFNHWLEDFNSDRNITDEEIVAARERFDRFNVDKIPDNVFSDVDMAVQKAGIVFEGDSGFSKEKIESMVRHTGFVETEYGKTIANTNEQDNKKARSHYQIEPKTAYSLVNPALSGALLGEKFNREFKYLVPEGSNKTAKEYLNDLYEIGKQPDGNTTNQDFLDILQNDKYLGATLAAGRYIQKHQQRNPRATGGFISLEDGNKVSNRFKLFEPKNLTEKALRGYQDLEDKLFKYADDVRKLSFGMQLEDAYPKNSQSRKNIEDNFAFIIDDMADQVIRGQAYINTNNYTKFIPENNDESVYGGASDLRGVSALEKYRKQELVDYLHEMYQSRVYDVVNSGLTEEEVMASSPKSIRELKDSVPGDRHIDAGHALEHRARKKYKDAKDPFLVDPNKTKPKAKPMPNPSQKSIITKPKFLDI